MALFFSGALDHLELAIAPFTAAPASMACWVNPNSLTSGRFLSITDSGLTNEFALDILAGAARGFTKASNVASIATSSVLMTTGSWFHVAVVYTSTTRTVYLNGVNTGTVTGTSAPVSVTQSSIGALVGGTTLYNGSIAYPAKWSVALSGAEISTLYNSGLGKDPRLVQNAALVEFTFLQGGGPYNEFVSGTPWSVLGTPTPVADPFLVTSAGIPSYPLILDTNATVGPTSGIVRGVTTLAAFGPTIGDQLGIERNLINSVITLETKLGIDRSGDTSSLEYRVRHRFFKTWVAGVEQTPPTANFATVITRNSRPLLAFADSVTSGSLFFGTVPQGAVLTGGVLVTLLWLAATDTVGNVQWGVAIERMNTDEDADNFSTQTTVLTTTASSAGTPVTSQLIVTTLDGLLAGEPYVLQIQRLGAGGLDTLVGQAQLQLISIELLDLMSVPTIATLPLLLDSFGFSTHFDQTGNPTLQAQQVCPILAKSGAGWIRDDLDWPGIEASPGVYNWANLKGHWAVAQSQGLKVVCIIGPNPTAYPADNYDPTGMTNFCKLVPAHIPNCVLEIINEPNNAYQTYYGSATWQAKLVTLTNQVTVGVHSVFPAIQVIGLGAQGSQITSMMASGGAPDGIVYHPYDLNDSIPEHTFEPPDTDYETWVGRLRGLTAKPLWETERNVGGPGGTTGENTAANWNARRMVLSLALQVEHTFLYDAYDQAGVQTTFNNPIFLPMQSWYVVKRVLAQIGALVPTGDLVTVSSPSSGFSIPNFKSYVFANGQRTVMAFWFGNSTMTKIIVEDNPLVSVPVITKTAFLSWPHPAIIEPIQVLDAVSGELTFRPQSDYGATGLFVHVNDRVQFVTIQ